MWTILVCTNMSRFTALLFIDIFLSINISTFYGFRIHTSANFVNFFSTVLASFCGSQRYSFRYSHLSWPCPVPPQYPQVIFGHLLGAASTILPLDVTQSVIAISAQRSWCEFSGNPVRSKVVGIFTLLAKSSRMLDKIASMVWSILLEPLIERRSA